MYKVCDSVEKNWKTVVAACHESSKTFLAARIAIDWMRQEGIVVTTAPTFYQISTLLWGRMRGAYRKSAYDFGGDFLPSKPFWKKGEEYYAIGISPKQPDNIQGHHTPTRRVLGIIDEASGVKDEIFDAFDSIITDPASTRLLEQGNPLHRTGRFAKHLKDPTYSKIRLDGLEVVKYSDRIPGLITQAYIDDQKRRYVRGENPMYKPRVRAMVPDQEVDAVLALEDWDIAIANDFDYKNFEKHGAIDWSAGGSNETVMGSWQKYKELKKNHFIHKKPDDTIGRALVFINQENLVRVYHDYNGIGRELGPLLRKGLPKGVELIDIDSSLVGKHMIGPSDPNFMNLEAYGNQRSLMWHFLQRLMRDKIVQLIPDHDGSEDTKDQLLAQTWFTDIRGRIFCTSKEDLKADDGVERMDRGDEVVYGVWGAQFSLPIQETNKRNPYDRHRRKAAGVRGYIG